MVAVASGARGLDAFVESATIRELRNVIRDGPRIGCQQPSDMHQPTVRKFLPMTIPNYAAPNLPYPPAASAGFYARAVPRLFLLVFLTLTTLWSAACSSSEGSTYGPYNVIGYNYTDRSIFSFWVNGFWGANSTAHQAAGGGKITCCLNLSSTSKTMHIKVKYELTREQFDKDLPNDAFETDIPVPSLPNKHDGFLEFHFLPNQRIEAKWVDFPTKPNIPNTNGSGG